MFKANYFLIFEFLGFLSFIMIFVREAYQRNFLRLFEIVSCAVFGMMLEIGNTYLAHTYSYSPNFLVNLANVPVAIGLGWAVIIYCAMLLSDQYNIPWTLRPFMDAFTAVILDLAIDTVAIRLGFWNWTIPLDKEWYGVPFENLIGWILVVLSFSFLIRFIRTLNYKRTGTKLLMLLSPILSYVGLMIGLTIFSVIVILPYQINNWTTFLQFRYNPDFAILFDPQVVFWKAIFFAVIMTELVNIVVWSLVKYRRCFLRNFDLLSFTALTGLHLFFMVAIFSAGIYREMPILAFISFGSLFLHLLIHFLPYLVNQKTIYFLKAVKGRADSHQEHLNDILNSALK
ncbi:carotenoid biosynthesis protein [Candidatus Falkowbacteria bacterium]|nr:carotenoid biosynthesis protein [Candidatus Falkowbacteria bacterium]